MLIHTPEGGVGEMPAVGAASIPVLAGKKIGLLDNRKPNADVVLEHIAERLAARTGTEVVRRDNKNAAIPCEDQVLEGIAKEVEIVLTGTGRLRQLHVVECPRLREARGDGCPDGRRHHRTLPTAHRSGRHEPQPARSPHRRDPSSDRWCRRGHRPCISGVDEVVERSSPGRHEPQPARSPHRRDPSSDRWCRRGHRPCMG